MIGISRDQWRLVAAALTLGGNVRVGLEDNFYLPDGEMARSNGDLIAKARRMVEDVGRRAATRRGGARAARHAEARGWRRERALEGVRVLDLSRLLPGGFCSLLLADFGAEVLKVEDTGMGDYIRWAPPVHEGAEDSAKSALFLALNRGKRSIRLEPEGGARARGAAASSCASTTCCSSRSGPACSTGSAWATSACARRTRGSSTARSRATGRTAPTATARATT